MWEGQVDSMYTETNRKLFMLRKLKVAGLDKEDLLAVYKGYVHPCLEYAALPWNAGLMQQQVNRLEKIQKCVCRYILSWDFTTYPDWRWQLSIQNLAKTAEFKSAEILPTRLAALRDFQGGSPVQSIDQQCS